MKYYEVIIYTDDIPAVTSKLIDMDITAMQIEDPADLRDIIENQSTYNWDFVDPSFVEKELSARPKVTVYFEHEKEAADVAAMFDEAVLNEADDSEWKDKYKEHFKALRLTDDIVVVPSWEEAPQGDEKVIDLDPGMAFGTGAHQTTSMCAQLLEKYGCE